MDKRFPKNTLAKRIKSMLAVDFRRMFTTPRFYIILAICLVVPVLILVMTTMTVSYTHLTLPTMAVV